jgi:membrane protein YqaA with SNARE-associated domain
MSYPTEARYDVLTPRIYVFGAILLLLGAFGIFMMATRANTFPLLTVFFYSISSNAAISILPHEPVIILYGKTINLWYLSISATLGTLLCSYLDYRFFGPLLNLSFTSKYRSKISYKRAENFFSKFPFITLVLGGFLPVPFYPFKFLALSAKYPLSRFLAAVAIGRFPRYYLLGLLGKKLQIPNWVIFSFFFFSWEYYTTKRFLVLSHGHLWR